jgi:hypothetical protein
MAEDMVEDFEVELDHICLTPFTEYLLIYI